MVIKYDEVVFLSYRGIRSPKILETVWLKFLTVLEAMFDDTVFTGRGGQGHAEEQSYSQAGTINVFKKTGQKRWKFEKNLSDFQ